MKKIERAVSAGRGLSVRRGPSVQWRRAVRGGASFGSVLAAVLAAAFVAGCQTPNSTISVTSYKDPFFPEPYELQFDQAFVAEARDRDQHVVAERTQTVTEPSPGRVRHFLHLQMFWKPRPGRTFADPSLNDAIARYIVTSPAGTVVYTGSAFVYPRELRDGRIEFEIEGGALRLVTIDGDPTEKIGDARLRGVLVATRDAGRVIDQRRLMDLYEAGAFPSENRGRVADTAPADAKNAERAKQEDSASVRTRDSDDAVLPLESP